MAYGALPAQPGVYDLCSSIDGGLESFLGPHMLHPQITCLGANRVSTDRNVVSVRATTYIRTMLDRYVTRDLSSYPAHWKYMPADDTLMREWHKAMATRTPASKELTKRYQELFGSLLHAVKYRPEISTAMGRLGR